MKIHSRSKNRDNSEENMNTMKKTWKIWRSESLEWL